MNQSTHHLDVLVYTCRGPAVHPRVNISHLLYMCGLLGPLFKIGNGNLNWKSFINFWLFENAFVCL